MEIQLGRVGEMSRGNKIANSSVPRKMLKTQLQVHYQRGKRGAEGERGTARQSAGEKGREQYKQNEAHVKIQERRGFVVTAATILPLPLAAYGRMQGRSQVQRQSTAWMLDQLSTSSRGRQSRTWQGTSKSNASSRL